MLREDGGRRRHARPGNLQDEIAEPAGAEQRRIQGFAAVGGRHDQDVPARLQTIELGHEARLHLVVNARGHVAARRANRIHLVEEHHDRDVRLALAGLAGRLEREAVVRFALRVPHAVQRARLDVHEARASTGRGVSEPVRQRSRHQGLASSGRAHQQHRGRAFQAIPADDVGVKQVEEQRALQSLDLPVEPSDLFEAL